MKKERLIEEMGRIDRDCRDSLLTSGMTELEAERYLHTISIPLTDATYSGLRARTDEFALSIHDRADRAKSGTDLTEYWLCLKSGGATDGQLEKLVSECELFDFERILTWLSENDLIDCYLAGKANMDFETLVSRSERSLDDQ